jgi:hypothetical protein
LPYTKQEKGFAHHVEKAFFFLGGVFFVGLFGFLRPKKKEGKQKKDTKKRITLQSMNA